MLKKTCPSCGNTKDITLLQTDKRKPIIYVAFCKQCGCLWTEREKK